MLSLFSVNTDNISKLFFPFSPEKILHTVYKGLSPGQLAYGQDKLNSMFLELFIGRLSYL